MKSSPILLSVLLFAFAALAEETHEVLLDSGASPRPPVVMAPPEPRLAKKATMAYVLLAAATLIPYYSGGLLWDAGYPAWGGVLIAGGLIFGPSAGQYYAGATESGHVAWGIRAFGAGVAATALLVESAAGISCLTTRGWSDGDGKVYDCYSGGYELAGVAIYVAGLAYSMVDTYFAVGRANARAVKSHKAAVKTSFAPALFPVGEGRLAPGVALNTSF